MRTRPFILMATCGLIVSLAVGAAESIDQHAAPTSIDQPAAPTSAKWVTRKLHFMYSPISPTFVTTHYSCDGLQDHMTSILRKLGASNDLVVRPVGCTRASGPEPFPGVDATFSVLVPAAGAAGSGSPPTVAARWEKVSLEPDTSCQLLDQVKRNVLQLFATRNVKAYCPVGFTLEVLRPVKPSQSEAAPH